MQGRATCFSNPLPPHALGVFRIPPPREFLKFAHFLYSFQCNSFFLPVLPPFAGWAPWVLGGCAHLMVQGLRRSARTRLKAGAGPQSQAGNYWVLTHQSITRMFLYRHTRTSGDGGEGEVSDEV